MKRLFYLVKVLTIWLFSFSSICAQTGSRCEDPIIIEEVIQTDGSIECTGMQNIPQWFSFTATRNGKITVSGCGSVAPNTYVEVYRKDVCPVTNLKVKNDNFCGDQAKADFIGTVEENGGVTTPHTYLIKWINQGATQSFNWTIEEGDWQMGEICSQPIVTSLSQQYTCDHSDGHDQWFSYTAPENGNLTITSVLLTSENTSLKVYGTCNDLSLIDENDDYESGLQSQLQIACTGGVTYLIQWENKHTAGSYDWDLSFEGISTGIDEPNKGIFAVRPNPTSGIISINTKLKGSITVDVNNLSGQLVKTFSINEQSDLTINISDLPNGIYLLLIKADSYHEFVKIIKR